jgi:hypothetical protein
MATASTAVTPAGKCLIEPRLLRPNIIRLPLYADPQLPGCRAFETGTESNRDSGFAGHRAAAELI